MKKTVAETPSSTILIVEDEDSIRSMLVFSLHGKFNLLEAETVADALRIVAKKNPDLILLDWMLPDQSGIELIKLLKKRDVAREIPIIMLTAKAEEENKVKGLESGADDYITKPFSPRELVARIQSVLRRGKSVITPEDILVVRDLKMNLKTKEVLIKDTQLNLTVNEYKLLHFFATHCDHVYSREQLLHTVGKFEGSIGERAIDALIKRLRSKLKKYKHDNMIVTIRGYGYKFSMGKN